MSKSPFFLKSKKEPFDSAVCGDCGRNIKQVSKTYYYNPNKRAKIRKICAECYAFRMKKKQERWDKRRAELAEFRKKEEVGDIHVQEIMKEEEEGEKKEVEKMNDEQFEEIKKILLEIKRALAIGKPAPVVKPEKAEEIEKISVSTKNKKKRSHNVYEICSIFYSHGIFIMSIKSIEQKAKEKGLLMPTDIGSTLRKAGKTTNPCFFYNKEGKGYQLTESGEDFIKEEFNVSKGTKELPKEPEKNYEEEKKV